MNTELAHRTTTGGPVVPVLIVGLRDRALIALMVYSFARVSAVPQPFAWAFFSWSRMPVM